MLAFVDKEDYLKDFFNKTEDYVFEGKIKY
jgi:hypothetical protein